MSKPDVSVEKGNEDFGSSRVDLKNSNVPPWIEKLRRNKK